MAVRLGLNMEFSRHEDLSFRRGLEVAAEIGYRYVEPMVHTGRQLLSEGGFFHSLSMLEDPREVRQTCESLGLGICALSSHAQLVKPDVAVDYIRGGIRFAAELGAPIVATSEGFKRTWTTEAEDFTLIRYSLTMAALDAERRGVLIGLEPHHQYSASLEGMDRLLSLVESPVIGVNFDTGNAHLGGKSDIYQWLEHILPRLVHVHAKDITRKQSHNDRGQVTGTAVGCACGEGVVDWPRIIELCRRAPRDIVLTVECGSVDEARRSYEYLAPLVGETTK
jgi:sugar phosphate isomerase/epimerase